MLCHGIRRICGYTKHVQFPVCVFHIHVVKSRTAKRKHLHSHFAKSVYNPFIYGIVYKYACSVKAVCKLYGVLAKFCFKKFKRNSLFFTVFFKVGSIIRFCIKKSKIIFTLLFCFSFVTHIYTLHHLQQPSKCLYFQHHQLNM